MTPLRRCQQAAQTSKIPLSDKDFETLEAQVRADWGGDRVFIARKSAQDHSQRNSRIMRDYLAGERLSLLERRYLLTQRRILQIIKQK